MKSSRLLDNVRETAAMLAAVDQDLDAALAKARRRHSWGELAAAASMSRTAVRYRVARVPEKRNVPKGGSNGR